MVKKDRIKIVKLLFKNSLTGGFLSEKKIRENLTYLKKFKTVDLSPILKAYKKIIEKQLKKEEVLIESPIKLNLSEKTLGSLMEKFGVKRIRVKENPGLILGARVLHGDWVYDSTLDAKLDQLKKPAMI